MNATQFSLSAPDTSMSCGWGGKLIQLCSACTNIGAHLKWLHCFHQLQPNRPSSYCRRPCCCVEPMQEVYGAHYGEVVSETVRLVVQQGTVATCTEGGGPHPSDGSSMALRWFQLVSPMSAPCDTAAVMVSRRQETSPSPRLTPRPARG